MLYYLVTGKHVGFAIWLRNKRESQGLTQKQTVENPGITYQTYLRFENLSKANSILNTTPNWKVYIMTN